MDALNIHAARAWRAVALALFLLVAPGTGNLAIAQVAPSEYDLKAAFVYQFLSYVSWPEAKASASVLLIGVVGAPELADNLSTLSRSQADGARMIEVRNLQPNSNPRGLHVLFVAENPGGATTALLQIAAEDGVLTITERLPRPPNSVINFEIIDSKVRFDIALGLARRNGLEISGRLLQVALRVQE